HLTGPAAAPKARSRSAVALSNSRAASVAPKAHNVIPERSQESPNVFIRQERTHTPRTKARQLRTAQSSQHSANRVGLRIVPIPDGGACARFTDPPRAQQTFRLFPKHDFASLPLRSFRQLANTNWQASPQVNQRRQECP